MHIRRHPFHRRKYASWPLLLVIMPQHLHAVAEPACPSIRHLGTNCTHRADNKDRQQGQLQTTSVASVRMKALHAVHATCAR